MECAQFPPALSVGLPLQSLHLTAAAEFLSVKLLAAAALLNSNSATPFIVLLNALLRGLLFQVVE